MSQRRERLVLTALLVLVILVLALGFLGHWSAPLDALSHFRAHLALGLLVLSALALLLGHVASGALGAMVAGAALYTVAPYVLPMRGAPENGQPTYTLLQMNLLWNAGDHAQAIRRIDDARPDIVTLQELTAEWRAALTPLEASYPYQAICLDADGFRGDSAILSRRPFVEGSTPLCDSANSLVVARVDLDGVPVTIASHHQLWPWPRGQWRRLDAVRETLSTLPAPLILAGDFNAAGWSAFLRAYADATGTRVLRGVGATWFPEGLPTEAARVLGLGIDNLLASPTVTIHAIDRPAATASDHLPVLVRFAVAPPEGGPGPAVAARR